MNKLIFRKFSIDIINFFLIASFSITFIVWIIQAVNFLDLISDDGHSLDVYFYFVSLNLPKIFSKTIIFVFFISIFYVINKYKDSNELIVLHCVSCYPANKEDLNLNCIQTLKKRYGCEVGYSGHETSVSPSLFAWSLGADYIERHITLDRSMWGTDQAASLEEQGMRTLSNTLQKAPNLLGNGIKKFDSIEKKMLKKFKYW